MFTAFKNVCCFLLLFVAFDYVRSVLILSTTVYAYNIVLLLSETVDVIQIRLSVYSGKRDKVFNIYRYNPYFQPILRALKKRALKGSKSVSGYNGFDVTLYKRGSYGYYLFIILIFEARYIVGNPNRKKMHIFSFVGIFEYIC